MVRFSNPIFFFRIAFASRNPPVAHIASERRLRSMSLISSIVEDEDTEKPHRTDKACSKLTHQANAIAAMRGAVSFFMSCFLRADATGHYIYFLNDRKMIK